LQPEAAKSTLQPRLYEAIHLGFSLLRPCWEVMKSWFNKKIIRQLIA
jgi:hypothetical protein